MYISISIFTSKYVAEPEEEYLLTFKCCFYMPSLNCFIYLSKKTLKNIMKLMKMM
jgi:hypothetical protein